MLPKTNYAIKVQAISDRGPGVLSDPYKVKTLPLPPKAPKNTEIIVHDNNSVTVKFDPSIDPNDSNKKIKVITYKNLNLFVYF